MPWDSARVKKHAAGAAVVGAVAVMAIGVLAFFLALRPSRMRFDPGQVVTYRLRTEVAELAADGGEGPAQLKEQELNLICISPDNDVVLLAPADGRDEVTLMNFAPNGTARTLDAASRPGDAGKALGFFDFNLLPLPPGTEQTWNVDLVYAVLPPNKRCVQGKVKRTRSGANPEFQLKLPTSVEWISEQNRYMQIRDLVCTYRFQTGKGLVDQASVRCLAGIERDDGRHRFRVRAELSLVSIGRTGDDPREIRDLALAGAEAQDALALGRSERLATLLTRLQAANVQSPRLRELVQRLCSEARLPAPAPRAAARPLWAVQVASCAPDRRADAEAFVRALSGSGLRAWVATSGDGLAVLVGPYFDRDPAVLGALSQRYPQQRAVWVKVAP
jgi:hypothetical protein